MQRSRLFQQTAGLALSLSAVALLLSILLPHDHGRAARSHANPSCRACQLHEGFSATPPTAAAIQAVRLAVSHSVLVCRESPRAVPVLELASPRAPPRLS